MAFSSLLLVVSVASFICYLSYERLFKKVKIPDGAKSLPGPKGKNDCGRYVVDELLIMFYYRISDHRISS